MESAPLAFSLPNAGAGPDPFSLADLPPDVRFVVLFFQRDHYCTNCRSQVQTVADRIEAFRARDAEPVSVVPEPLDRVAEWDAEYDLPYPLLADPDASVADAYDQPVRFGLLGDLSDFLGRMPRVVVVDRSGDEPEVVYAHSGRSTFDRPEVDELLDAIDEHRDADGSPSASE
jgi:peroxiredoxin Q/BCP